MTFENDRLDRALWCSTFKSWYQKAVDRNPNCGRLHHHLAILARPRTLEQLSLYTRSLTCIAPYKNTGKTLMTVFDECKSAEPQSSWETKLVRAHAILVTGQMHHPEEFDEIVEQLEEDTSSGAQATTTFKEIGLSAAIANVAALFEYGTLKPDVMSRLRLAYELAQFNIESRSGPPNRISRTEG